jgi:glycosyltransferase involved in cell wall biosynthesis
MIKIYFILWKILSEKGVHLLLKAYDKIKTTKPKLIAIGAQRYNDYTKKLISEFQILNIMIHAK